MNIHTNTYIFGHLRHLLSLSVCAFHVRNFAIFIQKKNKNKKKTLRHHTHLSINDIRQMTRISNAVQHCPPTAASR